MRQKRSDRLKKGWWGVRGEKNEILGSCLINESEEKLGREVNCNDLEKDIKGRRT
jgi:hypothetical protein